MLDYLLINGKYPDYAQNTLTQASIGIRDGVIEYIGKGEPAARQVIDVQDRMVSPGFIDIHMHEEDFAGEGPTYVIAERMLRMGVTLAVGGNCGHQKQPLTAFREMIRHLDGSPIHYMMLAGYNQCRYRLGIPRHEEASSNDRVRIRDILRRELAEGAIGVSFGIEYDPGITTEEFLQGAQAAESPEHLVAAHYRADGDGIYAAIREMIAVQSEIPGKFQISHLSSGAAMGQMDKALQMIHQAMDQDPRLDYDTYPYDAFSTSIGSEVFADDDCFRKWGRDYDSILLTGEPFLYQRCTKQIFEEARKKYPNMLAVAFVMREEEIRQAVADERGMIASDGILLRGEGHPRAAGTFPRVLGKYVREERALSLCQALRKMTLAPAERLGLSRKGRIEVGADADLVVFDPATILDGATFEESEKPPIGIDFVIVDGGIAMKDNTIVDGRRGCFISHQERN